MSNSTQLNQKQFEKISHTVYDFCGIKLGKDKQELVKARLSKRLYALNLDDFDSYLQLIKNDSREFSQMIDSLTTNKTDFFREIQHFDFLTDEILPNLDRQSRSLRIWSAACSSGEEPYSIAMTLNEALPDIRNWDVKILATDISSQILEKAHKAEYPEENLKDVSAYLKQKYFLKSASNKFVFKDPMRNIVKFARINLMDQWKMKGPFDVIFCRNVMIYFDKPTQAALINRFYNLIAPGGYLFVGHSESLNGIVHKYQYIKPAVYLK